MGVKGLGYLGLNVADIDAWQRFATGVVGLAANGSSPDGARRYRMDNRLYRLALHAAGEDDVAYIGLEVADARALDALGDRLESMGTVCRLGDAALKLERGVIGLLSFSGPSGVRIEAYYGMLSETHDPFISPRVVHGFATGEQGMGHVVLNVPSVDDACAFFCDGLGFRVSDAFVAAPGGQVVAYFLRCNSRHHTVAIAHAPDAPKRLQHMMVQTNSIDDVGLALDAATQAGAEISVTLGRHVNDKMFSFYMKTPSGFDIEYGCDGIRVVEDNWVVAQYDRISIWGHHASHAH